MLAPDFQAGAGMGATSASAIVRSELLDTLSFIIDYEDG